MFSNGATQICHADKEGENLTNMMCDLDMWLIKSDGKILNWNILTRLTLWKVE